MKHASSLMKDKNMPKNKNKGHKGKKWIEGREARARKEMEQITQDPRFSHVPFDPKLRDAPKKQKTVKLDSRFSSMFSDEKFYEKSTMDPRGRTGSYSTKEDLRQFYRVSSEESESDDDDDEDEKSESENEGEEEKEDTKATNEAQDAPIKTKDISKDILERLQDMTQDYARGAAMFSDDSSDDDSSTEDEDEKEKEFDWGELDQDAVWDTQQEFEETSRIAVCNLDWNNIKAVDIMVVFHSFCPRGGSIKKVSIYPSEFGKERMAEEDRFGPKELTSEALGEKSKVIDDNDIDLDKLERGRLLYRGAKENYEALRQYERNRLRYYYAVVECDSVDTAKVLYSECDRQSFERAGVYMDLRYIPAEMTFDEEPHDSCHDVPEFYEAKLFTTTALFDSQPTLTWDQTDPHRQKVLSNAMRNAMSGKEYNENYLKNFIASSSGEESNSEQEGDYSSDEGETSKQERIANFRALLQEIDEKEKKKKNRFDMEEVFGTGAKEEGGDDDSESEEESEKENDLNPFEKYLEKKRNKKMKKLEDKKAAGSRDDEYSDDEVPGGMEDIRNDPFFAEEMEESPKKGKKDKKKKKKKIPKEEESGDEEERRDLELLLMDEDQEEKRHFNMRDIIEEHKGKSKKKLKKNARKKRAEKLLEGKESNKDEFKVDTGDARFSGLFTSGDFNIDPSHPQFKRTKAIDELINNVQKKRMAENFENIPDPKRVNTAKGKEDHELSMLVKRVKNKAKKPK
ncbi:uncharacterized protein [Macrobrachium rosenbergii]|uniref:uncharacterized protein isoform X2 n=1 Tax=Macrobrachium rosenbergii TaxID=79674 RepID=UPI0034D657E2